MSDNERNSSNTEDSSLAINDEEVLNQENSTVAIAEKEQEAELQEEQTSKTDKEEKAEIEKEQKEDLKKDSKKSVKEKANNVKVTNKEDAEGSNSDKQFKLSHENKSDSKKISKTIIGVSVCFAIIIILFLIFSTIFALITSFNSNIINGVKIKDVDVSGLSYDEAYEKVSSAFNNKLSQEITLKHNDYETTILANQLGVSFDLEKAVKTACTTGRTKNIFQNNYDIIISLFSGVKVSPGFSYNEEALDSLISEMQASFPDKLVEPSYYIEDGNLILTKGADGVIIDSTELKNQLMCVINNLECNTSVIDIPVISKTASTLDLNKIHDEVYKAPQDAYYTTSPYAVYPHVDGIDFAVSVEDAINAYNSSDGNCTIALKTLTPNVTTSQIGSEAFPDLLATFTTYFSTGNVNRTTNIRLSTAKINGTVVMPGETFSYNQTVGQRTAAAGYKPAAVYANGEVTTGIGGGICQVSTTLYNSVLLANLEIVARYNHAFNPGYVPAGRDATVSWGGPDFKFKNSRNYPIKIDATLSGGSITVKIWGLKTDDEYDVEIQSYITSYIKYSTVEKKDSTMAKGTTKVLQSGSNGCRSVCYRILKKNGEVVSKTLLSNDSYSPHNRVVAVGTKE